MRYFLLRLLAAVLSGMLLAVIVPPFNIGPLVWIALVPLVLAIWRPSVKRAGLKAAALGWLAGMVCFGIQLSWLNTVSWIGALALPAYLACYPAAFAWFSATLGNPFRHGPEPVTITRALVLRSLGFAFRNAAVWAGLELLRGWVITGFNWNGLGVAFHNSPNMAQGADLLGIAGLSMVPAFVQFTLVQTAARMRRVSREGGAGTKADFACAAAIVLLLVIYGVYRISTENARPFHPLKSLLVQLNVPQEAARQLWDGPTIHMGYEDETLAGLEKHPDADWVIWPEVALTRPLFSAADGAWGTWQENNDTLGRIRSTGRNFQFLTGVNEIESSVAPNGDLISPPDARMWNSLAVLPPDGRSLQTFRKHHLVIFGETIPFIESLPFLQRIYEQQAGVPFRGAFDAGESLEPLAVPAGGKTIGVIPSICFEDTVPRLARKFLRPGPQIIVNVTNDGWFKKSCAAEQHFANARFRAIELRRPMIRCANTGVTAAIDTTGMVTAALRDENGSTFLPGSIPAESRIPLDPATSLYALLGDTPLALLATGAFLASFRRRHKLSSPPAPDTPRSHATDRARA